MITKLESLKLMKNHECKVELPVNAHLSQEYVPGERLRLDLYRRLADVRSKEDVESIREEPN